MSTGIAPTYPVRVEGRLDPGLSRWLWLVKWLLAIPHYIVLAFLWIGVLRAERRRVLRDPVHRPLPARPLRLQRRRAALDVARGVLRVRRPRHRPLSAVHARRADYPAQLEVEYPERLSRGLVLVKWWLLAIPHYIVVGRLRRRRHVGGMAGGRSGVPVRRRARRRARADGRRRAAVHGPLPARDLRSRARDGPVGAARRRLRGSDDGPLSALPARSRRQRPGSAGRRAGAAATGQRRGCVADALVGRAHRGYRGRQLRRTRGGGSAVRRHRRSGRRSDPARRAGIRHDLEQTYSTGTYAVVSETGARRSPRSQLGRGARRSRAATSRFAPRAIRRSSSVSVPRRRSAPTSPECRTSNSATSVTAPAP